MGILWYILDMNRSFVKIISLINIMNNLLVIIILAVVILFLLRGKGVENQITIPTKMLVQPGNPNCLCFSNQCCTQKRATQCASLCKANGGTATVTQCGSNNNVPTGWRSSCAYSF